jgi:hypothetical protein
MATFLTDLTPKVQGTNLADMINMARGVQAYQQAEQVNPYLAQTAKEQATQAQTTTKKTTLGLSQDQTKIINDNIGSVLNDERLTDTDPKRRALPLVEARQRVINSGVDPVMAEVMFAPIIDKAMRDKNPTAVPDMLSNIKNIQQSGIGATGQQALQTPSLVTTPSGIGSFKAGPNVLTPTTIGGQQPPPPAPAQPLQPQTPPPAGTPQGGVTPMQMSLPYPIRAAGDIRPFAPNEEEATKIGFERKTKLTNTYNDLSKLRYNIDQVIRDATKIEAEATLPETGPIGGMKRRFAALTGDPQYQKLEKDLANVITANEAALGHQTDAGRQLQESAGGKVGYDPSVLIGIAKQARGDTKDIEMQTKAIQNFSRKYGDNNIAAFQEIWGDNSDKRIFQGLNIMESSLSDEQKRKALQKIYVDENDKPLPQEEINKLRKKQQNLFKLQNTGGL